MEINYIALLDFTDETVKLIKLTPEEVEKANKAPYIEQFVRSLEKIYAFKLDNCKWMTSEDLVIFASNGYQDKAIRFDKLIPRKIDLDWEIKALEN